MIGSLYNAKGVVVGQAAGFIAPEGTPLPPDHAGVFDEATWLSSTVDVGGGTGNFVVKISSGNLGATILATANIAATAAASAVKAAIDAVLPAGLTSVVSGSAGSYKVALIGAGAARYFITGDFTGLTGATSPAVTPPLWVPAGATEQGWASNYNVSTQDIRVEEQQTPVGRNVTDASYEFVANLAEDTIRSLQWALGAARTVQAADSTHYGAEQLNLQESLPVYAVALESKNRYGLPRLEYVPSATCAVNVGRTYRRAAAQRMTPVTFSSICDQSSIVIREITAQPTG